MKGLLQLQLGGADEELAARRDGVIQVGQEVEIRPGKVFTDQIGKFICQPLRTRIVSLFAEGNDLQFAVPGGLIGVGTLVDPILCKGDKLLGNVMTAVGKGADIYVELEISCEWAEVGVQRQRADEGSPV